MAAKNMINSTRISVELDKGLCEYRRRNGLGVCFDRIMVMSIFYALGLGVVRESRTEVGHGTNHLQWTTTKYTPPGGIKF